MYALLAAVPGHAQELQRPAVPNEWPAIAATMHWRAVPSRHDQWALYAGQKQLGVWKADTREYWRLLVSGEWAEKAEIAPIQPPEGAAWPAVIDNGVLNFGVQRALLKEAHGITRNGVATTAAEKIGRASCRERV